MSDSKRFRVLITGSSFPDKAREIAELADIAEVVVDATTSRAELLRLVAGVHAIMSDATRIDAEIIERAGELKAVVAYGVGYDHIDLRAALRRGVVVSNSPEGVSHEVAEHAIGLLFALARQLPFADLEVKGRPAWDAFGPNYRPILLKGKTLGIVGFGRIGRETGRIAAGVGMKLLVHDPTLRPDERIVPADWRIVISPTPEETLRSAGPGTL